MKSYIRHILQKFDFWNLFIGVIIGFGAGVYFLNALVPGSAELIRMYRLDQRSVAEDKAAREAARTNNLRGILIDMNSR